MKLHISVVVALIVLSASAFAGQTCLISENSGYETREEIVGNEVIASTFLVTKFYVTVKGDEGFAYGPRGPFMTRELAQKDKVECEKLNQLEENF